MATRIGIDMETEQIRNARKITAMEDAVKNGSDRKPEKKTDSVSLTEGWKAKSEWDSMVKKFLNQLSRDFPGIVIWTETGEDCGKDLVSEIAGEMGDGIYLILSDSFLESMKSGKESFEKKSSILIDVMRKLARSFQGGATAGAYLEENQAVFWKVSEKPENEQNAIQAFLKRQEEQKSSNPYGESINSLRIKTACGPISYNTAAAYAKLAHAKNKGAIQNVMQQTHRQIASLRLLIAFSGDEDAAKAKAALRSYQKLLLRGNTKMRQLSEDQLTERKRKRAVEKEEQERAAFFADQVRRNRVSRSIRDGALIKEGQLEELQQMQVPGYQKRRHYPKEIFPAAPQVAAPPSASLPAAQTAGPQGARGMEFSVVEVQTF